VPALWHSELYRDNISPVGGMWRVGDRTILAFVGGDVQKVEVYETPQQIPRIHLGSTAT
jgi:hypothetical protein